MITFMDKNAIIKLKQRGLSNRQIAKQIGINRKTVDKYWTEYESHINQLNESKVNLKSLQEQIVSKPKYNSTHRKSYRYTAAMDKALEQILESEKEKLRLLGSHKQKLTNTQIYQELLAQGFAIGKTTISNKIKEKRQRTKECFIRQEYEFGDRLEFDFGEVKLILGDQIGNYHMAVFSSPAGDFRWCYLYTNQSKDVFLDAHVCFFDMVKGTYKEVVYDNMKNVVTRFIGKNQKQLNDDLVKMSIYYGFDINVTNCFSGNEKGHVEGSVKILRNKIFGPRYQFESFAKAVEYMNDELIKINQNSNIELEKNFLLPHKPKLELANIKKMTVDKYSFVRIANKFYSVPDYLVGKTVTAKIYYSDIDFYANDHYLCTHKKIDGPKKTSVDIRHYLRTFERKPGALCNSLALKSIPELKTIYDIHFKSNPKKFIEILRENQEKDIEEIIEVFNFRTQYKVVEQKPHSGLATITLNQLKLYNGLSIKEIKQ